VDVPDEEILWYDRKRIGFFGLPWTFTRYHLTPSRLLIDIGFFNRTEDEIRLYRITDITFRQSFWERLNGVGTLCVLSSDSSQPEIELRHIKRPKKVKEVLSQSVEKARRESGVRTSELVGGPHDPDHDDGRASLGPQLFPDANHNGIDDRRE